MKEFKNLVPVSTLPPKGDAHLEKVQASGNSEKLPDGTVHLIHTKDTANDCNFD